MKRWSLGLTALALVGCGSESAGSKFSVTTNDTLVANALPAIRQACPGLDKYASQFKAVRVEDNYRTSVVFDIPETAQIPDSYKAGGHSCFVEIDPDGKSIIVEKLACKSVCLDQAETPNGPLKIALIEG